MFMTYKKYVRWCVLLIRKLVLQSLVGRKRASNYEQLVPNYIVKS